MIGVLTQKNRSVDAEPVTDRAGAPPGFYRATPVRSRPVYSPERIEREEIGVAGDDQIGVAVDSQLQKFIVLRITTGSDSVGDRDQLGRRQQFTQPISKAQRDQRRKTRAGQGDEQLSLGDR
jgi:hypothetical protein